jgi:ketosteroid isomerase-like protein
VSRGRAEVAAAWSGFFKEEASKIVWRPEYTEVLSSGDLAFSRGPYRLRWNDDKGEAQESWGTFNSTWRLNADGQWRVLFDAGSASANLPSDETMALLDAPFNECE